MTGVGAMDRRQLLLGGLMISTAAITFARLPRVPVMALRVEELDTVVPETIGAWRWADSNDVVVPPETADRENVAYDRVLARTYVGGDAPAIMLLIAYDRSQSGMLQVHRPEACYPASGYRLSGDRPTRVVLSPGLALPARQITAVNDARVEQILYWTRVGDEFPLRYDEQRASVARQNLHGLVPDGALIRVSTIESDAPAAQRRLRRFAQSLFAGTDQEGRALLAGPLNAASRKGTA